MSHPIPEDRRRLIVRAAAAGCPWSIIAALSGHNMRTVTRVCQEAGHRYGRQGWRENRTPLNEREIASITKLVPSIGYWRAALAIGRSYEVVRQVALRHGICSPLPAHRPARPPQESTV